MFYRWGPQDAWALTWTQLAWWNDQGIRMLREMRNVR